jgi:hypothetical protein
MKIPVIKKLVETCEIHQLEKAEIDILEGQAPAIEVEGSDEGEQLTHVMAAIWILHEMKLRNLDFKDALREYTKKVRESIN